MVYPKLMAQNREIITSLHPYWWPRGRIKEIETAGCHLKSDSNYEDDEVMMNPRVFEFLLQRMEDAKKNQKIRARRTLDEE